LAALADRCLREESMFRSSKVLDTLLKEETRRLSLHLPRERKTLERLLRDETPSVKAIDGSEIILNKDSLEKLARLTPATLHGRIALPIILLRRLDLGKSVFVVLGDIVEQFTVRRLLGMTEVDFEHADQKNETLYLYRPHVAELVREFNSLFVIGFVVGESNRSSISQS